MPKTSAGLLMFRRRAGRLEVMLVHPGGPLYAQKDLGVWSIPKGLVAKDEDPVDAARREFEEETGLRPTGELWKLGEHSQPSGKLVTAWAFEGDCDPAIVVSNSFTMEWPPHSGRMQDFREVDRAAWFPLEEARRRILIGQLPLLGILERVLQ